MLDRGIFARYLDLSPLGGRTRGKVQCCFHTERTASLSVDLDAGLFHCFGCGEQGGILRFAELVGESTARADAPPPADVHWMTIAERIAREQRWSRGALPELYAISDFIRMTTREVAQVRAEAADTEAGWEALARVATLERVARCAEAETDAVLSQGSIT